MSLVLSLFPGIGLLDRAFEEEGFCVVRGPDVLWGGDIRNFHPPHGKFHGIIGGPPCQAFSSLAHLNRSIGVEPKFGNLIPEFERVVEEASPGWYIMENVPQAPIAAVEGYQYQAFLLSDAECGGHTSRDRRLTFGRAWRLPPLQFPLFLQRPNQKKKLAVTGSARKISVGATIRRRDKGQSPEEGYSSRLSIPEMLRLQGLPENFFEHSPFNVTAQRQMLGNGVPMAMGRAIARAVKEVVSV